MHMSAFMVEDKTINRVVTWLTYEVMTSRYSLDRLSRKYKIDLIGEKCDEKLAYAMFQLNCDGVNARYGASEAEKFRPLDFAYRPEWCLSLVQVLKSLQCWMYQCCEGDVPQSNLYRFFEEVEAYLASKIVKDLPEYNKAEWG